VGGSCRLPSWARIAIVTAPARLHDIIECFASRRVVLYGDLVLDRFVLGTPKRISREAPVIILRFETQRDIAGGGANALANLAALGATVLPVGVVGDDDPPVSWVVPSAMRLSASPRALDSGPRVAHATSDTFFGSIDTIFILASMPSRLAKRVLRKGDGLQGNVSKSLPALQPVGAGGLILVGDCFRTVEIHLAAGGSAGLAILVIDGKEDRTAFHLLVGGPSFPTAPPDPLVPLL